MEALPNLDREALRKRMLAEFERTVTEVADAVDGAKAGRLIRDSEEPARVALDRFRQVMYETAMQGKMDAAEAAFPPPVSPASGRPMRHKGRQAFSALTVNGRLCLRRVRWHCPQGGCQTPLDKIIEATEQAISQGVREMACRLNRGSTSFAMTAENLQRAAHLSVSRETLRQLIEQEGRRVLSAQRSGQIDPGWTGGSCGPPDGAKRV